MRKLFTLILELMIIASLASCEDPIKDRYDFGGWYEDEELTELFDFDQTMPAENFTLYAKWVANE